LYAECLRGYREKLLLSDAHHRQVEESARGPQAIAKELAVRGVNQSVRRKYLFQLGKRAAGSQEQSTAHNLEVALRQIRL
jgi:hypothetical protein